MTWQDRRNALVQLISSNDTELSEYRNTDADLNHGSMRGQSPHSSTIRAEAGVRVVFNIPAVYVRDFARAGYKNRHDLGSQLAVGATGAVPKRVQVDGAVAAVANAPEEKLYYGAAELNGAGVRYYGDVCLVLTPGSVAAGTVVLDRNSFDLARKPISDRIKSDANAVAEAQKLQGSWPANVGDMAVCKILGSEPRQKRLITTGKISEGLLADEDYMEVVRTASFTCSDLEEARTTAADAGVEGRVGDRLRTGPIPRLTEVLWRQRRRSAERELASRNVVVRTVVTSGRTRT